MAKRRPQRGRKICGAKLRSPGKHGDWKCHIAPMPNGKCYRHGGATPAGIASPHFKHGRDSRYLKHLPVSLALHFDPDSKNLVALTEELGVLEARIIDVLDRMKGAAKITTAHRKELDDLFDRKSRLVSVESRRRKDEHEMVARDQFGRFAAALLGAVGMHVEDAKVRGLIQEDVLRVLALSQVPLLQAGDGA